MGVDKLRVLLLKAYKEQRETLERIETSNMQYDRQSETQITKSLNSKISKLQSAM